MRVQFRSPHLLHTVTAASVLFALPALSHAHRVKDPAKLLALSQRLTAKWQAGRGASYEALLHSPDPHVRALNEGPRSRLVYVDETGRPIYHGCNDLISAETISTDEVWAGGAAGFALDGFRPGWQVYLAIWEAAGAPRATHQEFAGRITQVDAAAENYHATRVAGIAMASGVNANAKGMSPNASLLALLSDNDSAEMAYWAGLGVTVSNHSYSPLTGWNFSDGVWAWYGDVNVSTSEDDQFGKYTSSTQDWDQVAYDAPTYVIVGGAGNDRNDTGPASATLHVHFASGVPALSVDTHPADGGSTGYDTMPSTKCGKNMITVGGINDIPGGWATPSDAATASFSSWGPTDDGRIKPDIVANATGLTAPDSGADNNYTTGASGCSYAGPAVAGSVNLILQEWENKFPLAGDPLSSTIKALLVHTADEAGTTGPDYIYGWGVMNTRTAVELVDAHSLVVGVRILEPTLQDGATDEFDFWWDGESPFSVTMAWTDPPGTPPGTGVDLSTIMLVNDLDLRVERLATGVTYEPWLLDPTPTGESALTGDNYRDNVEQVHVANPPAGYYRAIVTHKSQLDSGSQDYSLILPAGKVVCVTVTPRTPGSWVDRTSGWWHQWVHQDNDARQDIVLLDPTGHQHIYRNEGGGIFSRADIGALANLGASREVSWGDFDNDGDADCFVGGNGTANRLFRNNGSGGFANIWSDASPSNVLDAVWVDANADGFLDLYLARSGQANRLYRNNGGTSFTDATPAALAYPGDTQQAVWANIDADRWPEVFLANSDGPGRLFDATSAGYSEIPLPAPGSSSYGAAWADVNNDGHWDLYVANQSGSDRLLLWTPSGYVAASLPDLGSANGSRPGVVFGDLDLDGDVDAVVPHRGRILENQGGGVFGLGNALPQSNAPFHSASCADDQTDGHLDLFLGDSELGIFIQGDPCNTKNWIEVDLSGVASNRAAIGAVVTIQAGGVTQKRQVGTGAGACGEGPLRLHFGLGTAAVIDLMRVDWPSGRVAQSTNVAADRLIHLTEVAPTDVAEAPEAEARLRFPNPLRAGKSVQFRLPQPGPARLAVYGVDGRFIRCLAQDLYPAGDHAVAWDGRDARGREVRGGVYFLRIEAGGHSSANRFVYLK